MERVGCLSVPASHMGDLRNVVEGWGWCGRSREKGVIDKRYPEVLKIDRLIDLGA